MKCSDYLNFNIKQLTFMKKTSHIFLLLCFISSCDLFMTANEYYLEAETFRNNGNPKEAIKLLKKITTKFSDDTKTPDAQYLIAEIYYRDLQDFSKSIGEYRKFSAAFPENKKAPFSIFMQGYIHANELMNHDSASIIYKNFIDKYPNHEMVESVKFELKYLGLGINEIPELKHLIEKK